MKARRIAQLSAQGERARAALDQVPYAPGASRMQRRTVTLGPPPKSSVLLSSPTLVKFEFLSAPRTSR
jgi:hypothetical protein